MTPQLGEPIEQAYLFREVFMRAWIIVASLLLACSACSPHRVVQSTAPSSPLRREVSAKHAVFESDEPNPGHFCFVGTKDCMTPTEMYDGFCFLSTARCKSDARAQVAGVHTLEMVLPIDR
jgi:hypothetical protein